MKAIIPAAGYATRLYPLTKNFPKGLLEVGNKPIVGHVVDKIREIGIDEIILVTNSRYFPYFEKWAANQNVKVVDDGTSSNEARLGQVGDILFAVDREKVDDDVLVVSGDNLFDFSLKEAQVFFMKKKAVVNALFDCKDIDAAKELGTVVVDSSSRFVEFFEKSPEPKTTLVSAGVYFFPKEKIRLMRQYVGEGNNADKIGYFLAWLLKKEPVFGYKYGGRWFDIGIRDVLDKAKKVF